MRIEDVCSVFTDGDWIETKDQSDAGIRLIQTGNIGEGSFIEKSGKERYISEDTFERLGCTEIFPGDILVSRLPDPVGRGCIIPEKTERMITAVDCTICRVDEKQVDRRYFCYFLQSPGYYNQLMQNVTGTTRKRISRKNLGNVTIDLPPISVQKDIIDKLDKLSNILNARKQELQRLDELIKARFVEMFGDLRSNPRGWPVYCFEDITEIITDGEHATPRRVDQGIYLLSARNVLDHALQLDDVDFIDQDEYDRIAKRIVPQAGDVLISCSGSVGRCCTVPEGLKFQMVRSAALLRFDKRVLPVYAEYMITSDDLQDQINSSKTASSQANLFQGKIAKLKGFVPPIAQQEQFVAFVAQIDKSKSVIQKSLDETQLLFDSLMQKYFG